MKHALNTKVRSRIDPLLEGAWESTKWLRSLMLLSNSFLFDVEMMDDRTVWPVRPVIVKAGDQEIRRINGLEMFLAMVWWVPHLGHSVLVRRWASEEDCKTTMPPHCTTVAWSVAYMTSQKLLGVREPYKRVIGWLQRRGER